MTNEELVRRLRIGVLGYNEAAASRIEALTAERDEALNQRDSARHSVGVLEKRVAFVEEERRKTFQALLKVTKIHDEVEAKLAKAVQVVQPDRDTFDAMCAMRNAINEYIPMPSLESDLLQGPENSVFCATVAEAVIAEVKRLRALADAAMEGQK
jgi:hypothetical protein